MASPPPGGDSPDGEVATAAPDDSEATPATGKSQTPTITSRGPPSEVEIDEIPLEAELIDHSMSGSYYPQILGKVGRVRLE